MRSLADGENQPTSFSRVSRLLRAKGRIVFTLGDMTAGYTARCSDTAGFVSHLTVPEVHRVGKTPIRPSPGFGPRQAGRHGYNSKRRWDRLYRHRPRSRVTDKRGGCAPGWLAAFPAAPRPATSVQPDRS